MHGPFWGCRTCRIVNADELLAHAEPRELDESAAIEDTTVGAILHRAGTVRVCIGDGCETHVGERLTVKRSRGSLAVEARVHAAAHRAAPTGVTEMLLYVRAPGTLAASAIVSRTHGVDGSRFLRDSPSADSCVAWTAAIAAIAAKLGAARIVHGDLKLNNTCVLDGAWRVIDFGHSAVHSEPRVAPNEYIYDADDRHAPFNASFDMRVFIWSCVVHAADPGAWTPWLSHFECAYPLAWKRYVAARRSSCGRMRTRALHAMYQPVYAQHDAEFEPSRVLDTIRVLRAAPAEP